MKAGRLWAIAVVVGLLCGMCAAEVVIVPEPYFIKRNIHVAETIDIKAGAQLGMIDSNEPFCLMTDSNAPAAIRLGAGIVVPGDILIGKGGDPNSVIRAHPSAVIAGDVNEPRWALALEPVFGAPEYLLDSWLYRGTISANNFTIAEDGRYDSIAIERAGVLGVVGDCTIYVVGDMRIGADAQVVVTSGSRLILYLGGNLRLDSGSAITSEDGNVENVIIWGTDSCNMMDVGRKSVIWGLVYAPSTHILNSGTMAGIFAGRSMTITNQGSVYGVTID